MTPEVARQLMQTWRNERLPGRTHHAKVRDALMHVKELKKAPALTALRLIYPLDTWMRTDTQIIPKNAATDANIIIQHPASGIEENVCLVEPGEYELQFITYRTYWIFKRPKMAMWFRIVSPGPAFGLMIPRHYNLKNANSRGGFKVGRIPTCCANSRSSQASDHRGLTVFRSNRVTSRESCSVRRKP